MPPDTKDSTPGPKPWPHEWRAGMRLLPVPDMEPEPLPAAVIYYVGLPYRDGHEVALDCVDVSDMPGRLHMVYPLDPRIQPDLDDDGTVGHLKGMVRERYGARAHVRPCRGGGWAVCGFSIVQERADGDHVHTSGGDPVTISRGETEGLALKAALDHLAAKGARNEAEARKDKTVAVLLDMARGLPPSLIEPGTFHCGGFVGSTADDEVS